MRCNHCNNTIDDRSTFCPYCGSQQPVQQWQQPVQQNQQYWGSAPAYQQNPYQQPGYPENAYQQPAFAPQTCPRCGSTMVPGAQQCGYCGWSANPYPAQAPAHGRKFTAPAGGQGKKIGILAGAAVLLVLIVVLIGSFTNWFGMTGPVMTVANATQKTFEKGNFTVEFFAEMDYESIEGVAYVDMDMKKQTINLWMELEVDDEEGVLAIYDEYVILVSDGYYEYIDISEALDVFFDTYEKTGESELDWEDILDEIDPYVYDDMSEYVDFRALNQCIKAYTRQLNNAGWLKKNAGYSTKSDNGVKKHILDPDLEVFLPASVPFFEDAIKDPDTYQELLDAMDEIEDVADEVDIYAAFGVKGGKLVSIESEIEIDGEELTVEAYFSDIGKTKLDPEKLEDLLKNAKKYG